MKIYLSHTLKAKLRALPDKPGCYLMRAASGRIIYVGKAASLRKRVRSYFRAAGLRSAPPKIRSLVHSIADLDIITAKSEADAILTENKLIKDYRPRFNILLRDDKRFPLLSISLGQKWPRFRLGRIRRNDGALYFGPYLSSAAARAALEFVEKKFGLRKCAPLTPDKETHRHCLNDIIRFCSAPCIGKISPAAYRAQIDEALAFLRGERPAPLNELRNEMDQAAAELDFEKAAVIRDALHLLSSAVKHRAHIAGTDGISAENARASVTALHQTLGLKHQPTFIQAVDISNISGKHAVGSMVAAMAGICRPALYRRFRITTLESADDAAMMAEIIRRHFKRLKEEGKQMPDLLLIDGGIVQLRATQSTLRNLGLTDIPVAGLAKKLERIFLDHKGRARVIVLPSNSPALQLLQRLRDEAHRFALAYHHRLRAKLIRESVLDDIAGLGARRKEKLLRCFGSASAIARAPEKAIASLSGIGPVLARRIKSFLNHNSPLGT
ncbi:MAG: excinuclease ABC subunit UvrC [Kiritimatiellia bacterium]|nr:excinuclease ABC subunit UvrC [Kiritimatiellia bacterium]